MFFQILTFIQNELASFAPIWSGDAAVFILVLHILAYVLVQPGKHPQQEEVPTEIR